MIRFIESDFNRDVYNDEALHPLQSWEWGEARQKMGLEVWRIGEFSKDQLSHVFQLTIHPLPHTCYNIAYLPRSAKPSAAVLDFLLEKGKRNNIIFIKIEPYVFKKKYQFPISNFQTNFKLIQSPHPLFPDWTQILNLHPAEDELLKKMKSKTRYNIKLAQKKRVVIKEMSDDNGFKIFSRLYFDTCKRQHYFGHTPSYHEIVWNSLKKNIAHLLIAFYENTPVAAYELFHFNKTFYYPYGGTSLEYRNVMAANLLMWEAIRLAKKLGAEMFDMWGSLPSTYDQKHDWAGFTRFKEGYGTEFVQMMGSYDLVINPLLYRVYNVMHLARNSYLQIKKMLP